MPLFAFNGGWEGVGILYTFSFLTLHFLYIIVAFWLFAALDTYRKNDLNIQGE